ncbi:phosphoglycerate dehydrogenase [Motilimonas pumila]|uniref:D-3-phosphoglycerate dehydrogenase n=1 Tax=Motilimonas pumila TaxID=2303987 RepID=A0A418YKI8_9GAMM|nr:phosphoglycerate dehydrogenase [Motilimonas pumila]RJG51493.1 ACT domain-containing protein [Motilimonas pumila]
MFKIRTHNTIATSGLSQFDQQSYQVEAELPAADAVLLRSHSLHTKQFEPSVKAIARAGAGVNNIPVNRCSEQGIVVFNTPGANANAVKELVICALLLASRGIVQGIDYSQQQAQSNDNQALSVLLEQQKKQFKGCEIKGKTLGVIGLGAIGALVASDAIALGMKVVGYDPAISVEAAWRLPASVEKMENINALLKRCDYVTLHVPFLPQTENLINSDNLSKMKPGACLLNFSRSEIVDSDAVLTALEHQVLQQYLCDFPDVNLINHPKVTMMPHLGASTREAEANCADMAVAQLKDFLENGNIKHSVNMPDIALERTTQYRLTFINHNVPGVLGEVLSILAKVNVNVIDMLNKSRNEVAYNILDTEQALTDETLQQIEQLEHVTQVRQLS